MPSRKATGLTIGSSVFQGVRARFAAASISSHFALPKACRATITSFSCWTAASE